MCNFTHDREMSLWDASSSLQQGACMGMVQQGRGGERGRKQALLLLLCLWLATHRSFPVSFYPHDFPWIPSGCYPFLGTPASLLLSMPFVGNDFRVSLAVNSRH